MLELVRRIANKVFRRQRFNFPGSAAYWEERYICGGSSGSGSYDRLAEFKAQFLNSFIIREGITTVIEFGCGDGAQLSRARYPSYVGVDISHAAVHLCQRRFAERVDLKFFHTSQLDQYAPADLALSLDVIYHLVEDVVFFEYMHQLFDFAKQWAIIYSSDFDASWDGAHERHRKFTSWVAEHRRDFELVETIANPFPFNPENPDDTSLADIYVYRRV